MLFVKIELGDRVVLLAAVALTFNYYFHSCGHLLLSCVLDMTWLQEQVVCWLPGLWLWPQQINLKTEAVFL